ncbi:hypothetical protein [Sulfobacillus harzensis]|uniref:Spore cortex biosynthesis protein YabQ n=1 Tax=Sulfobacillus harzensis TaxID=2729629 RepID=A0A7Y0L1D2_9FIRM|nr:hypothetical protein [Sulfobacillus harzensis]NMP21501.1 hypothetical protein [Sulfobacillus harzensis]
MPPNDAFFIIAVWILTGMGFGMLSTAYGACRITYRMQVGVREFLDWFWFVLVGMAFVVMLFWTEWGTFRIWSIAFVLVGYGLWTWLAAPVVMGALLLVAHVEARAVYYTLAPVRGLIRLFQRLQDKLRKPPKKG